MKAIVHTKLGQVTVYYSTREALNAIKEQAHRRGYWVEVVKEKIHA